MSASPDAHSSGLLSTSVNPLRYDGHTDDPHEVAGVLKALMPSGARVLDVGCGTGSVTLIANGGKGNTVTGLEPDHNRVALAQQRGIDARAEYLDQRFVAEHGKFDVVTFADVLEHLPSPDEVLKLAVDCLRPGGCVIASVPNVAHWSLRLSLLAGCFEYTPVGLCDATHLRWFTEKTLLALFRSRGLHVDEIRYTAGTALSVYSRPVFRVLPRRLMPPLIRLMTALFPRLFACQLVIKASKF